MYEREFLADVREKKRTASGAFKKRGKGVKHGFRGALQTPYYFMSKKEKAELNGKVVTYSMREIMTYEQFITFDKEKQKELLESWRKEYKNQDIINRLGITNHQMYYDMIKRLDVKRKTPTVSDLELYTQEQLEEFKKEVDFETLKAIPIAQRAEVFDVYDQAFSTQELMELWGVSNKDVHAMRGHIKRHRKRKEEKNTGKRSVPVLVKTKQKVAPVITEEVQAEAPVLQVETPALTQEDNQIQIAWSEENEPKFAKIELAEVKPAPGPFFGSPSVHQEPIEQGEKEMLEWSGEYCSATLQKKLDKLKNIVEDEPFKYRLELKLVKTGVAAIDQKEEPVTADTEVAVSEEKEAEKPGKSNVNVKEMIEFLQSLDDNNKEIFGLLLQKAL